MLVCRDPGSLDWIPVKEIGKELATLAYSPPFPDNDLMNIVEATSIAEDLGTTLISNKDIYSLCVEYPKIAQQTWRALCKENLVRTMLSGTIVFAPGSKQNKPSRGKMVMGRGIEQIRAVSMNFSGGGKKVTYTVPRNVRSGSMGLVEPGNYEFEEVSTTLELVVNDQRKIRRFPRRWGVKHIDYQKHFLDKKRCDAYPVLGIVPSVLPRLEEPVFSPIVTYCGSFDGQISQFFKLEAALIVVTKPLPR